jgi:hypothetical protein
MRSNVSGITSLVLILVAFSSLVSMIALTRIDSIVHRDLYNYNLRFSYSWAIPYWTMITLVFAMGWFNIIIAVAFQFYVLLYGRRRGEEAAAPTETVVAYREGEEVQKPRRVEEVGLGEKELVGEGLREETVEVPKETPSEEYMEAKQLEEAREIEAGEEEEITPRETAEAEPEPEEESGISSYVEEEKERERWERPEEPVETETQETSESVQEIEVTASASEEEKSEQEAELAESYPT